MDLQQASVNMLHSSTDYFFTVRIIWKQFQYSILDVKKALWRHSHPHRELFCRLNVKKIKMNEDEQLGCMDSDEDCMCWHCPWRDVQSGNYFVCELFDHFPLISFI